MFCMHACICTCMCVCAFTCLYMCVCMCMDMSVCIRWVCYCICICMSMGMCVGLLPYLLWLKLSGCQEKTARQTLFSIENCYKAFYAFCSIWRPNGIAHHCYII